MKAEDFRRRETLFGHGNRNEPNLCGEVIVFETTGSIVYSPVISDSGGYMSPVKFCWDPNLGFPWSPYFPAAVPRQGLESGRRTMLWDQNMIGMEAAQGFLHFQKPLKNSDEVIKLILLGHHLSMVGDGFSIDA